MLYEGMAKKRSSTELLPAKLDDTAYATILASVSELLETARHAAARAVNSVMTTTYWEIGKRIVEQDQQGRERAAYGQRLSERLSDDLTKRFGRGLGIVNLTQMRKFYQTWPHPQIVQTASEESSAEAPHASLPRFPLSCSHYVRLLSVD
jgi:hypothetical protein